MSTVIYSNGHLVVDSGHIVSRCGERLFSSANPPKLHLSKCKSVVIGSSGDVFKFDCYLQELADEIAAYINNHGSLSDGNNTVTLLIKRLTSEHKNDMSLIVMTSFDKTIYHIESAERKDDQVYRIRTIRFEDSFGIGSGSFFAITALNSGLSLIAAMKFAIRHDTFSRLPINTISYEDLLPYEEL